jgi:hypothetical protein
LTTEQLDRISAASIAGTRATSLHEADNPGDSNGNGTRHNAADLPGHDGSSETAGEPLQQFRGNSAAISTSTTMAFPIARSRALTRHTVRS